jgi:hypothetical protein
MPWASPGSTVSISGDVVAKAMVNAALDPQPGTRIFTLDEIFQQADRRL